MGDSLIGTRSPRTQEAAAERRVLDLLIDAARRLKWRLNYRGSKDTNDLAQQAYEDLLRRGRRADLLGDTDVGALLWKGVGTLGPRW